MKGFIEIGKDSYEDTIEHLYRLKTIACKMIKKLEEHSELYDHDDDEDEEPTIVSPSNLTLGSKNKK